MQDDYLKDKNKNNFLKKNIMICAESFCKDLTGHIYSGTQQYLEDALANYEELHPEKKGKATYMDLQTSNDIKGIQQWATLNKKRGEDDDSDDE